jgi:hypothetical protein
VLVGDRLVLVGKESTRGWSRDETSKAMRGAPGSRVTFTVERGESRVSFTLVRDKVHLRAVQRVQLLQNGVGYVDVNVFSAQTATELSEAVDSVVKLGARSLVMDLRGNPGGLLEQGVAVAELFFGAVIGLLRQLPAAALSMQNGVWDRSKLMGRELKGKTLGIVGLGRIGSEVALRAHAFGMTVVAFDPYIADERFTALRVRLAASLDALIGESNILTMHVPLNDETRGMIGKRELGRLPARSIAVNMARGGIIDEAALLAALEADQLRGAVLDVFTAEPLAADSPLRTAPNLLLTPHLGANTVEAQRNVSRDVCLAVRDALLHNDLSKSINVAGGSGEWGGLQPAMLVARRAAAGERGRVPAGRPVARRREALRLRWGGCGRISGIWRRRFAAGNPRCWWWRTFWIPRGSISGAATMVRRSCWPARPWKWLCVLRCGVRPAVGIRTS